MSKPIPCFKLEIGGLPIALTQQAVDKFTVTYHKQVKDGLNYSKAALELGTCIMHALACEDKLDNSIPHAKHSLGRDNHG